MVTGAGTFSADVTHGLQGGSGRGGIQAAGECSQSRMGGEGGRGEGRPRKGLALTEQEAGAAGRASVRVAVGPAAETGRWGRGTVCGSPGGGSLVCADLQVSFRSTQVRGDDLPKSEVTPPLLCRPL